MNKEKHTEREKKGLSVCSGLENFVMYITPLWNPAEVILLPGDLVAHCLPKCAY